MMTVEDILSLIKNLPFTEQSCLKAVLIDGSLNSSKGEKSDGYY